MRIAVIVVALLLASPPVAVLAQTLSTPAEIQQHLEKARDRLKLDSDQYSRLSALLQEESNKLADIKRASGTRAQKSRQVMDLRTEFRARLTTILDKDQIVEWDKMRDEAIAHARSKRKAH